MTCRSPHGGGATASRDRHASSTPVVPPPGLSSGTASCETRPSFLSQAGLGVLLTVPLPASPAMGLSLLSYCTTRFTLWFPTQVRLCHQDEFLQVRALANTEKYWSRVCVSVSATSSAWHMSDKMTGIYYLSVVSAEWTHWTATLQTETISPCRFVN